MSIPEVDFGNQIISQIPFPWGVHAVVLCRRRSAGRWGSELLFAIVLNPSLDSKTTDDDLVSFNFFAWSVSASLIFPGVFRLGIWFPRHCISWFIYVCVRTHTWWDFLWERKIRPLHRTKIRCWCIQPMFWRERKQALSGDPESERRAFAFRLGEWEVRWVIRGAAFCEGMPSEDSEGSKKMVIQWGAPPPSIRSLFVVVVPNVLPPPKPIPHFCSTATTVPNCGFWFGTVSGHSLRRVTSLKPTTDGSIVSSQPISEDGCWTREPHTSALLIHSCAK